MHRSFLYVFSTISIACGPPTTSGSGGGGGGGSAASELVGTWVTPWGDEVISETRWQTATIVSFDNSANRAITQMPEDDEFNPSKYSRITWTDPDNEVFHYCTEAYGQESEADAEAAEGAADPSDLEAGCSGFPWTRMQRPIAIAGSWSSEFSAETITHGSWDNGFVVSAIDQWDNAGRYAVLLAPEDAEFGPNTYSIIHWLQPNADTLHYCTSQYGLESADELNPSERPDDSDPDNGGCGDFPWTKLERD